MSAPRIIEDESVAGEAGECRRAKRSRVFMRANLRVAGTPLEYPISIKDVSATGLKAAMVATPPMGTRVEIDLRNIGWVAGEVVWGDSMGMVGIRLSATIEPERTQNQVSGVYRSAPASTVAKLRRV